MSADRTRARARLEGWRERVGGRLDPVRLHRIEALQRRAAGHEGEVRRLLEARLSGLIDAYADDLAASATQPAPADRAADTDASTPSAMSELIGYIAAQAPAGAEVFARADGAAPAAFPQLAALDEFTGLWSKLRLDNQLRRSLAPSSTDAGPLNSGRLVHRALTLMSEQSPGYLQEFLAYVDALSWVEQMSGGGVVALEDTLRTGAGVKRVRDKARKRRE